MEKNLEISTGAIPLPGNPVQAEYPLQTFANLLFFAFFVVKRHVQRVSQSRIFYFFPSGIVDHDMAGVSFLLS